MSAPVAALAGLAEAMGLPFELVDPLLEIHHRAAIHDDHQPQRLVVADPARGSLSDNVLNAERPRVGCLDDFIGQQVVDTAHHKSPYAARALTRYVAVAVLMPFRWLQRKAVTRRAVPLARPSGTIQGGAE